MPAHPLDLEVLHQVAPRALLVDVVDERVLVDAEVLFEGRAELLGREPLQAAQQTVGREDGEPRVVHGDERHHAVFEGLLAAAPRPALPHLVAVHEGDLIAVVPVGDEELLPLHLALDVADPLLVGHAPEPVGLSEVVLGLDVGRPEGLSVEDAVDDPVGVVVEHEDLSLGGADGVDELEAVLLGLRERVLVGVDAALAGVLEPRDGDEPLPRPLLLVDLVDLVVGVDRGLPVLDEDLLVDPLLQGLSGSGVPVAGRSVTGLVEPLGDADDVVRRPLVVRLLHRLVDLVVRLGEDLVVRADLVAVVEPPSEREDPGHAFTWNGERGRAGYLPRHCAASVGGGPQRFPIDGAAEPRRAVPGVAPAGAHDSSPGTNPVPVLGTTPRPRPASPRPAPVARRPNPTPVPVARTATREPRTRAAGGHGTRARTRVAGAGASTGTGTRTGTVTGRRHGRRERVAATRVAGAECVRRHTVVVDCAVGR